MKNDIIIFIIAYNLYKKRITIAIIIIIII